MSFESFMALKASAGSGKTFALSLRFCALILKGAKINEILALTFTKKAANEMKARIIKNFLSFDKAGFEAEAKYLLDLLCEDGFANLDDLVSKRDELKSVFLRSNLHIYTFDSFFVKIIRSFSLHLGLMSDFVLTNSLELGLDFVKLLSKDEVGFLAKYLLFSNESKTAFANTLQMLSECLINASFKDVKLPDKEKVLQAYEDFGKNVKHLSKSKLFLNNFTATTIAQIVAKPVVCDTEKKYFNDLDFSFWNERTKFLLVLDNYYNDLEKYKLKHYLTFLQTFLKARFKKNILENTLSFSDATRYTHQLLCEQNIDKELIYFKLDSQISHLLIDEFQDTNIFQYEILKPLISELVSGKGTKEDRSFFYVGDVKQSIYRFRGAKKELFAKLQLDFKQIKSSFLDTNYRSKKVVVDFVNEVFTKAMPKVYKDQISVKEGGFVSVDFLANCGKNKSQTLEYLKPKLQELIENFEKNNLNLDELCILCWTNNDASFIRDFLQSIGVKAYTDSNLLLLEYANVRLVHEYIKYLLFNDGFARQLISEYLGFVPKRFELKLEKSVFETVVFLAKKLGLNTADLNLISYFEYAASFDDMLDFLFTPCKEEAVQNKELGVCVMTVHKSKGLEFKHLCITDKLSSRQNIDQTQLFVENEGKKSILCIKDKARKHTNNKAYTDFFAKKESLDNEDLLNQLYVAFTRAKENLFILAKPQNSVFEPLCLSRLSKGVLKPNPPRPNKAKKANILKQNTINTKQFSFPKEQNPQNKTHYHFGLALHEYLQDIDFANPNYALQDKIIFNKYHLFLNNSQLQDISKRVSSLLTNEDFCKLIKNMELLKEQPLYFEGKLKIIDLLAKSPTQMIVFDYKSWEKQLDEHAIQVGFYKKAIKEITKLPTKAYVIYVLKNSILLKEII